MSTFSLPASNPVLADEIKELRATHQVDYLGVEAGVHGILILDFSFPRDAYRTEEGRDTVDLLLRVSEAYPHANPDMFWLSPRLLLHNGAQPAAGEQTESYFGRAWQRFSWHIQNFTWTPIADTLAGTFVPFIEHRLQQRR